MSNFKKVPKSQYLSTGPLNYFKFWNKGQIMISSQSFYCGWVKSQLLWLNGGQTTSRIPVGGKLMMLIATSPESQRNAVSHFSFLFFSSDLFANGISLSIFRTPRVSSQNFTFLNSYYKSHLLNFLLSDHCLKSIIPSFDLRSIDE